MRKGIVAIVDNKIDSPESIKTALQDSNSDVEWLVLDLVPDNGISAKVDVLFIHINNEGAISFIQSHCDKFKEIYITSASPSQEQLTRIRNCDKVKLFDFPLPNETVWKSLEWAAAITKWEEGKDFPIKYLKPKGKSHLIALSILCQGYLAAHGDDNSIKELTEELKKEVQDLIKGLPDELRKKVQTKDNENKTKGKSWWTTVIDKTEICRELEGITDTKDCGEGTAINALITNIFNNGISVEVKKVAAAYSALKSILQGK